MSYINTFFYNKVSKNAVLPEFFSFVRINCQVECQNDPPDFLRCYLSRRFHLIQLLYSNYMIYTKDKSSICDHKRKILEF